MSDAEYDKLYRELEDFEAQYPQYRSADSPTTQVGGAASEAFAPVEHLQQMTSLDDVFSLEELAGWETRMANDTGRSDLDMLTEVKIDGLQSICSMKMAYSLEQQREVMDGLAKMSPPTSGQFRVFLIA